MKKLKLFSGVILAMISALIVGCSKDGKGSSSSLGQISDSSPIGGTSSGGQTPNRNALEEALNSDYSNATIYVEQVYPLYEGGELFEEYTYELNYEGYKIIQNLDNPDLDDLYYHDYEG